MPTAVESSESRASSTRLRLSRLPPRRLAWFARAPPPPPPPRDELLAKVMARPPADPTLRCTVLDAAGAVRTTAGQFTKADLSAEHRLHVRPPTQTHRAR